MSESSVKSGAVKSAPVFSLPITDILFRKKYKMDEMPEPIPKKNFPIVGNVYEDLKERITNPFLFSYAISFSIINWKIWIGLFFLNREEITARRFRDVLEYLYAVTSWTTLILWPLVSALAYSFLFPWFKNLVLWVQAKSITASNKSLNEVAKGHVIPVNQYLELEENLEEQKNKYEKAISLRSQLELEISGKNQKISDLNRQVTLTNDQVIHLNNKLTKIATSNEQLFSENKMMKTNLDTLNSVTDELMIWKRFNSESYLQGEWLIENNNASAAFIKIEGKSGHRIINSSSSTETIRLFTIKRFAVNLEKNEMIWLCKLTKDGIDFFELDAGGFFCYEVDFVSFKMSRGNLEKFVWKRQPKLIPST